MFRILGIDHLVLRVSSLPVMQAFYCGVLGCTLEREAPELGLTQLRAGGALIDLVSVDGPLGVAGGAAPGTQGRNLDHFCLALDPFDAVQIQQHLQAHAVPCGELVSRYGASGQGPSIYISDPEGNTVELKGPPWPTTH
jgi:catechol 2,3-dioxygenase-like lactoylglutathione lyase family enzyme